MFLSEYGNKQLGIEYRVQNTISSKLEDNYWNFIGNSKIFWSDDVVSNKLKFKTGQYFIRAIENFMQNEIQLNIKNMNLQNVSYSSKKSILNTFK